MIIDCDTCVVRGAACGDCVITVLLRNPPLAPDHPRLEIAHANGNAGCSSAIDLDADEQSAVQALAAFGLVPPLRLVPASGEVGPDSGALEPGRGGRRGRQYIA